MTPHDARPLTSRLRFALGVAINAAGLTAVAMHVAPLLGG